MRDLESKVYNLGTVPLITVLTTKDYTESLSGRRWIGRVTPSALVPTCVYRVFVPLQGRRVSFYYPDP